MSKHFQERRTVLGCALFALAAIYVWWIAGDLFNLGADEGIYLEGGRLVSQGRVPYRDFFVLTGPLTFWMEGALAHLGGVNIPLLRLPLILDVAFLVWAVYWLGARFQTPQFGLGLAVAFLAQISTAQQLVVKHRWDSAALATLAVVACVAAGTRGSRRLWLLSGALAAAAAWATPSLALVGLPLLLAVAVRCRRYLAPFAAGACLVTAVAAAFLASQHALGPMLESMRWTAANYAGANSVPYGSMLSPAGSGLAWSVRGIFAWLYRELPAILPIAAVAGWGWRLARLRGRPERWQIGLLLGATVALVLSALPRWSAMQLAFVEAIPFALCGILLDRVVALRWRPALYAAVLILAGSSILQKSAAAYQRSVFHTRAGLMTGSPEDAEYLEPFENQIRAGDSLFVFPYLPVLYPLLDGKNPSRYLYLQPGMMTGEDEQRAISDLEKAPPLWVVEGRVSTPAILAVWPGSDPARIPMTAMYDYIASHYRAVRLVEGKWGAFTILKRADTLPQ